MLEGLADGSVDIVIGTHRLVQRDVRFKNLGLVVIDEEQRFGVRQKEFLKKLRTEVDILTMSATPIPRTLHMALAGIRDISMIDTAPQARLPIRTFVTPTNDQLIREVILRELDRGGQVYFVHNRVHDIDHLAHKLRQLVPEARFGVVEPFGALRTFGLHKGYGLALACELLGGALTGGGTWHSDDKSKRRVWNGMLSILIDPARLDKAPVFGEETKAFLASLRKSPAAPGFDRVRIAGEPERETRARREREGVPVDDTTWKELLAAAAKVKLPAESFERLAQGA